MVKKTLILAALICAFVTGPALSADQALIGKIKEFEVSKTLLDPEKINIIDARDIGPFYEVVIEQGGRKVVLYVTKDGKYAFQGNLFDVAGTNLMKERVEELNKVDFAKIPFDDAIVIKKGDGSKKLVMVTDVDCPYCKTSFIWLQDQTDYTLYVFLMPLDQLHPQAREKSIKILCSKDPVTALVLAETNMEVPAEKCAAGEAKLKKQTDFGTSVGITGTPLFILDTGAKMMGFNQQGLTDYLKKKK
jgi:thiol:disulfide interchange protein DsbC